MELSSYTVEALTRRRPLHPSSTGTGPAGSSKTNSNNTLKRTLGLVDVVFYGVGCSVGAGIYSLVGIGADLAGPSIAISFLVCGIACTFTALSYAEFSARDIPNTSGSAYTFAYVSFGELVGWLVGWNLTLGYAVSAAVVARSWAEYLVGFVNGMLPPPSSSSSSSSDDESNDNARLYLSYLTKLPVPTVAAIFGTDDDDAYAEASSSTYYTCCPLSMVLVMICTLILVTGVRESTRFNTVVTILNLSVLGFVLVSGVVTDSVSVENLTPVFPHGVEGMARGAGLVFFAYLGFDMVACLAEETVDPERNMPLGIVGSLAVSLSVYVSVATVVVGMVPNDNDNDNAASSASASLLGDDTPIVNALLANACCTREQQLMMMTTDIQDPSCLSYSCRPVLHPALYVGSRIVSLGAVFGLTAATFACLMGQPRINLAAARDGLIFPAFARVHPITGVPTVGTVVTGVLTASVACLFDLESLADAISLGTLQVFTFVNAGVILLRTRPPAEAAMITTADAAADTTTMSMDESSPLIRSLEEEQQHQPSPPRLPVVPDAESLALALGLIRLPSREISDLLGKDVAAEDELERRQITVHDNGSKPVWLVLLFTVSAVVASGVAASNDEDDDGGEQWQLQQYRGLAIVAACALTMIASAGLLFRMPKSSLPGTFACPFVPAVPLLGIACNSYMMGSMPRTTWLAICCWLAVGLLFYFGYGIHHSELKKAADRQKQKRLSLQPASSATPAPREDAATATAIAGTESNTVSSARSLSPPARQQQDLNYHTIFGISSS